MYRFPILFRSISFRFISFRFVPFCFVPFYFVPFRFTKYNKLLFWTCSETNLFWQDFKQWLVNRTEVSNALDLSPSSVLGLKPDNLHRKHQNFYFLVSRFFIWVCKMYNNLPKIENFSPFLSLYNTVKPSLDIHSK